MKSSWNIVAISLLLISVSCMPKANISLSPRPPQPNDAPVGILDVDSDPPCDAQMLGFVKVEGCTSLMAGDFDSVSEVAVKSVRDAGGNVLNLTSYRAPKWYSLKGGNLEGEILYVDNTDSLDFMQVWDPNRKLPSSANTKFELSLGISGIPYYVEEVVPFGTEYWWYNSSMTATDMYRDSFYATTGGVIALQGAWQFHKKWALIGSLGYSPLSVVRVNPATGVKTGREHCNIFTMFAGARFFYISRPRFKLYSSLQGGLFLPFGETVYWQKLENPDRRLGIQLSVLGMQFGGKLFFEIETYGVGDYFTSLIPGFSGRLGLGYRF